MFQEIDDHRIEYDVYGEGKVVLCIHGWLEDKKIFKNINYKEFLKGYKVISIDLPDIYSSKANDFDTLIRLIDELMNRLGIEKFSILGQCMGSSIAMDYARKHKERIEQVILVEPIIFWPWWANMLLVNGINKLLIKLYFIYMIVLRSFRTKKSLRNVGKMLRKKMPEQKIDNHLRYLYVLKEYSKTINYIFNIDEKSNLKVKCITGENTFKIVEKSVEYLKRRIKNIEIEKYKGKNHFVFYYINF